MIDTFFGYKGETIQKFTQNGIRIPVTEVKLSPCQVAQLKAGAKDGYSALKLKLGRFFREVAVKDEEMPDYKVGTELKSTDVFAAGDKVKVSGISKGKGFQGVVKRWGFKGGPKTHGQSDRERHPGAIGQRTTPGRIYKGKRMAGRMGGVKKTIRGLQVMAVGEDRLLLSGLLPGPKKGFLVVTKTGRAKKFVPLKI